MTRKPQSHSVGSPTPFGAVYPFADFPGSERGANCSNMHFRLLSGGPRPRVNPLGGFGSAPAAFLWRRWVRHVSLIRRRRHVYHAAFVGARPGDELQDSRPHPAPPARPIQTTPAAAEFRALKSAQGGNISHGLQNAPLLPHPVDTSRTQTKVWRRLAISVPSRLEIDCIIC